MVLFSIIRKMVATSTADLTRCDFTDYRGRISGTGVRVRFQFSGKTKVSDFTDESLTHKDVSCSQVLNTTENNHHTKSNKIINK